MEDGEPVEHFIEILSLKKANANFIYDSIIDYLEKKGVIISNMIGMGFDGAAAFSGKHNGVQPLLKRNSPHSIFVHCQCHLLHLACVQAANSTPGINTTLTALWKYFHYLPKRAESLREIQQVLRMPELKIVKPSDTRWLAHERCVKTVKENYSAIVMALNNLYEETHEPEALGISRALSKKSAFFSLTMCYLRSPNSAEHCNLKGGLNNHIFSCGRTLHTIDDALNPAASWMLTLQDIEDNLEEATSITITMEDIKSFTDNVGKPFVSTLNANINSRFSSQDVVSAFSIFDPPQNSTC